MDFTKELSVTLELLELFIIDWIAVKQTFQPLQLMGRDPAIRGFKNFVKLLTHLSQEASS